MKYTIYVNQAKAIDLGLTNINQAMIFDLLTTASTWAKPTQIDGEVYYWVARQAIVKELPILGLKPDTAYRHLKALADLGLISYKKAGKKDCIRVTEKGKSYLSNTMSEANPDHYVGNESELAKNTEMNPKKLGNESENNSEMNPTYPTTKSNQTTNLSKKGSARFVKPSVDEISQYITELAKTKPLTVNPNESNRIFDHYESKGWVVGKSPMRNWKAAVRGWLDRNNNFNGGTHGTNQQQPTRQTSSDRMRAAANQLVSTLSQPHSAHG